MAHDSKEASNVRRFSSLTRKQRSQNASIYKDKIEMLCKVIAEHGHHCNAGFLDGVDIVNLAREILAITDSIKIDIVS